MYSSCQKESPKLFYKFYLQIWEFKIKYRLRTSTIFTTAASLHITWPGNLKRNWQLLGHIHFLLRMFGRASLLESKPQYSIVVKKLKI